ncbi:threonine/serine exporter family protein [Niveibacterium sp. SC-1]|uniref:threonine/serine ThrE exporter family protein n=1 Tax=Niveibacterium sp. SC-1 TaxID=3135646 RepID=UPI00311FC1E9
MSLPPHSPHAVATEDELTALLLLQRLASLLIRFNVRSALLERQILRVADVLGVRVGVHARYRGVTLYASSGRNYQAEAHELKINVAISAEANRLIDRFCDGLIGPIEFDETLRALEAKSFRHNRWILAAIFGVAAAALARLLRADAAAVAVSGVSAALGLLARQTLAARHPVLYALPFAAALIGAFLGGLVIRAGWTTTPGFCLMVPALMLVPGPHLINGLYDILENHIESGMARLALACGILVAAAAGVFLGGWLALGLVTVEARPSPEVHLTLWLDVVLAGAAACGFGAFYNTPWRMLWVSVLCGMVGHGIRYVLMGHGVSQEIATLWACLPIGLLANLGVARLGVPFASIAFAGAVPMMPGTLIYEALEAAMRLAGGQADVIVASQALGWIFKAGFVVGGMGIGLLVGARMAGLLRIR